MKYVYVMLESFGTYFYLIAVLRWLGKKEFGKLSVSDLIVFLIISELMTISIGDENVSFFQAALSVLVIIVLDKLCSYIVLKNKSVKKILEGNPTYIIYKGKVDKKKMAALKYSVDDLCQQLRAQGIGSISEVEFAIMETDGNLSIIEKKKNQVQVPDPLIVDGEVNEDTLTLMNKDKVWLLQELNKHGIKDPKTVFYCVMEKKGLYYIKK